MKILELIDSIGWCGTKEQTFLVTRGLSKLHDVEIAINFDQHEMAERLQGIVPVHHYESDAAKRSPIARAQNFQRLHRIVNRGGFGAVIANSSRTYQQLLTILPFVSRKPIVVAMRRSGYLPNILSKHLKYRFADKIVVVSDEVTEMLKQKNFLPDKLASIPSGIDLSRFKPEATHRQQQRQRLDLGPDEKLFINVANWQPWRKGQDTLLGAFAKLNRDDYKLILVGHHTDSSEAEAMIAEYGLSGRVMGLGFRQDVEQLLQAADYFVFTSRSEGIAGAVLQAMASGKVVVSTPAGGIGNYLKHEVNGYVTPIDGVDALSARLESLFDLSPERYRQLIERAIDTAQAYSIDGNVDRWHRMLEELASKKRRGFLRQDAV